MYCTGISSFLSISTIGTYVGGKKTKKGKVRKVETKTLAAYYIGSSGIDAIGYFLTHKALLIETHIIS